MYHDLIHNNPPGCFLHSGIFRGSVTQLRATGQDREGTNYGMLTATEEALRPSCLQGGGGGGGASD